MGGPVQTAAMIVPSVKLKGGRLYYRWLDDNSRVVREVENFSEGFLDRFLELQEPQDVLHLAQRYGVLVLCKEHELPIWHLNEGWFPCPPMRLSSGWFCEPVAAWIDLASRARLLVERAAKLHEGGKASTGDWWKIADEVNQWLITSAVTPICGPASGGGLGIRLVHRTAALSIISGEQIEVVGVSLRKPLMSGPDGGLFTILALQILAAVARKNPPVLCDECGHLYLPERRPRKGERHYCPRCGHAAAVRVNSRLQQQAKRTALRLHRQGVPVADVARRVKKNLNTVKRWIQREGER